MRITVQVGLLNRLARMSALLMLSLFFCGSLFAQRTVSGTVTSQDGESLIGASVFVRGTSTGTVTDIDGAFSISVAEGFNTLIVSYTGYETREIQLTTESSYQIILLKESLLTR